MVTKVTVGYKGLERVTGGYREVTGGYKKLQRVTEGYRRLQGITEG